MYTDRDNFIGVVIMIIALGIILGFIITTVFSDFTGIPIMWETADLNYYVRVITIGHSYRVNLNANIYRDKDSGCTVVDSGYYNTTYLLCDPFIVENE